MENKSNCASGESLYLSINSYGSCFNLASGNYSLISKMIPNLRMDNNSNSSVASIQYDSYNMTNAFLIYAYQTQKFTLRIYAAISRFTFNLYLHYFLPHKRQMFQTTNLILLNDKI